MKQNQAPRVPAATDPIAVTGATAAEIVKLLRKKHGLTFGDCATAFCDPRDRRYIAAAQDHRLIEDGTLEVDDNAVVSRGDDPGAYVQAWLWVYRSDLPTKTTKEVN